MFVSEALKNHLETSATINTESLVLAEWNMNMPDNIFTTGNYRYRPLETNTQFNNLPSVFDENDSGGYYTGALDSDVVVNNGFTDQDTPQSFTLNKEKLKLLYSLESCLNPFRPRSGINKALYFNNKFLANSGKNISERPRYYLGNRDDEFKYWTSYRTENNNEYGISKNILNDNYYIYDTVPFVVYKNYVPANRLILKMQTNVGTVDLGPFTTNSASIADPFYGDINKTTPKRWRVQYLDNDDWVDAYIFNDNDLRDDQTAIIGPDGYVELQYGLIVPQEYKSSIIFAETYSSVSFLPTESLNGYAYLVIENKDDVGIFYIWNSTTKNYDSFVPKYGWQLATETINNTTRFVSDLTSPSSFVDTTDNTTKYREFQNIRGIRIVVETMNKFDCTFDLIEMSPRLVADISNKTVEFSIKKILSDLGSSALPVGQLLASTGSLTIFDDDQSFNDLNQNSIVKDYTHKNVKFNFYEKIINVEGYDYYVPIKTLYSKGFPQSNGATITLELRDFYFFLESITAPRMLITQVSLSYAISLLLDSIGFSNYRFLTTATETDPIIPYFFIAPEQNVAQVLSQLAISTQTAMFFDEYNNFIIMNKNYIMPDAIDRTTDKVLIGSYKQYKDGIIENQVSGSLPNIMSITSQDKKIYNDGKINYTTRYIQRSYGTIKQSSMIDQEKTWIYKPVLLWEVAGTDETKTINEVAAKQGSYVLGAMPLNSDLLAEVPAVVNGQVTNNIFDLGENVYWLTRYQGYFYSNGEIIKYDAAQFNVTGIGNVWISNNQEYQNYFQSLPFNGKIYPTGLVRIYSVPFYETVDGVTRLQNGVVQDHGRAQFGTPIANHYAGIDSYWSNNDNVRGCMMQSKYLFTTEIDPAIPATTTGAAGVNNSLARQTSRNGILKNFMTTNYLTETQVNSLKSTQSGTVQSSALIVNGPSFATTDKPIDFISYINKPLNNAYKHFGTRMRIIGKIDNSENRSQSPIGSATYYQVTGSDPNKNINIGGGSGGLAVLVNPETNNGYYFEIVALTENNIQGYLNLNTAGQSTISINNIVFYKIKKNSANSDAIPVPLWKGLSSILVDDGRFTGQYRTIGEQNPTVYDLSVEYQDIGTIRRFYLYINNKLIKVVDDTDPLPVYNNMAPFVRGSSRIMFENIYALSENYSQNTVFTVGQTLSAAFGDSQINANESFAKYAMSGIIQSTYLSGISSKQPPKYNMYFEEFGTIMRECAYFNIKYDRAWPALYAKLSPTFNRIKGYTTSGFYADSYGAEFLIFNSTDTSLNLDETTGNYLRIQGITFTQDTTHQLTVDDYFKKRGNLSSPQLTGSVVKTSPLVEKAKYDEIKLSRLIYGTNDFTLETPYIQTQDDAEALMGWIINKTMNPKKAVGIQIFADPTIQLGDIITIDYKDKDGIDIITSDTTRFVVYNIEYNRKVNGPEMTIYLSEV